MPLFHLETGKTPLLLVPLCPCGLEPCLTWEYRSVKLSVLADVSTTISAWWEKTLVRFQTTRGTILTKSSLTI